MLAEPVVFTGKNVHGPGKVSIRAEAVCNQSLLLDVRFYIENPKDHNKKIRRNLCVHLPMANALTLADAIKNSYQEQANKNYIKLMQKVTGIWHC